VSFLATIHEEASRRKLRLLVSGGLAVNYCGCSRETAAPVSFLSFDNRTAWMKLLGDFGYASRNSVLRRIEENMPWRDRRPGEAEHRLAEVIPVEFVL
jgi:hypothetical protein